MTSTERSSFVPAEMRRLLRPLHAAAQALEVVAIVGAIGGVILGIAFATTTSTSFTTNFLGSTSPTTSHPYVAAGIAIAFEALISGLLLWAIGRGLRVISLDCAARYDVTFDSQATSGVEVAPDQFGEREDASMAGSAPGWYRDPWANQGDPMFRYWNGLKWTGQTREKVD